ncbi:MAG: virulence protein RhuM/Fic/DOC family protein [Bacteroidota bacterium]
MSEIEIYKSIDGQTVLEVKFEQETIWLNQQQMAELFKQSKQNISLHINNVFKEKELDSVSVVMDSLTTATDGKSYKVKYYNLDVIISVGYRVKSIQGTQFRQWATQRLKDYLVNGYALNEKRLQEASGKFKDLREAIKLASKAGNIDTLSTQEAKGILTVLEQYAYALETLDKYDHQSLTIEIPDKVEAITKKLNYEKAIEQIRIWNKNQNGSDLFGNEKDQSFKSSLDTIYQTFNGVDLYPSIEEKAANLLYFIVKNHSFTDGNKRIAAGLFVYFLDMNNKLLNALGNKRIGDNALVAITIMIAESKSEEKDIMVKLVVNLINSNN